MKCRELRVLDLDPELWPELPGRYEHPLCPSDLRRSSYRFDNIAGCAPYPILSVRAQARHNDIHFLHCSGKDPFCGVEESVWIQEFLLVLVHRSTSDRPLLFQADKEADL